MSIVAPVGCVALHRAWTVWVDARMVAVCDNRLDALRIQELIDRHGLVDVPDTPEEITA